MSCCSYPAMGCTSGVTVMAPADPVKVDPAADNCTVAAEEDALVFETVMVGTSK